MQQYFAINKNLELLESDYHHIKNVMRMKVNDKIKVVYDNVTYLCELSNIDDIKFNIIKEEKNISNKVKISIAFGLIKEQKLDYLFQKGTEVGISEFIPVNMIRSVVKIDSNKEKKKIDRWNKILKEASEQSFRSDIPNLTNIKSMKDLINLDFDLKLICSLNENTENIKKVLQKNNKYDKILLVVGPEGGFDLKEENLLIQNGFKSISLGDTVLRAETAPIVASSMINYELMR